MSTATSAAKPVDLVMVIDTSGSMADEAAALSASLNAAVEEAKKVCPSELWVQFLGIEGTFSGTAFDNTVRNYLTGKGVDVVGEDKGCRCHEHDSAKDNTPQPDPCPPFSDITTFEGDNWNGRQARRVKICIWWMPVTASARWSLSPAAKRTIMPGLS